jgi:peptidoglycan/xylan/chitin deacetylase (PgdA/CDA1 family)
LREILDYAYDNPWTPTDNVAKTEGKVVLLMHERAFRKGKLTKGNVDLSNYEELNKLRNLIDYFIEIKADFKTLDNY